MEEMKMNLKDYLVIDDKQKKRIKDLHKSYRRMYEDPEHCHPMIIVDVMVENLPGIEERLVDPKVMLKAQLDEMRPHLQIEDDRIPTLRVELGSAQVAAAFGCEISNTTNSYPAVKRHVLENAEDVYKLAKPSLDAGMYPQLKEFTSCFLENMPSGMQIQPPDLQSPFNCSNLIRGTDIFLDFYDNPEALNALLDIVTDYLIELAPFWKSMINSETEWFLDYGVLWKGGARISNCSMHMISPEFYRKHVLERDVRFFKEVGGGRIHYCGTNTDVINDFFKIPNLTGVDFIGGLKAEDVWAISVKAPENIVFLKNVDAGTEEMQRLISGKWPEKRNIIVKTYVNSVDEAKDILNRLRESIPY